MSTVADEWVGRRSEVPRPKTWTYQSRVIVSRKQEFGAVWALLDCGHVEPATGKDLWKCLWCQQCDPVKREHEPPKVPRPPRDAHGNPW